MMVPGQSAAYVNANAKGLPSAGGDRPKTEKGN